MKRENRSMADAPSKKRWDKENTYMIAVKFQKKTDQDCIDFLEGKNKRDTICAALREYMANHPAEEDVFIPTDSDDDIMLDPEMW